MVRAALEIITLFFYTKLSSGTTCYTAVRWPQAQFDINTLFRPMVHTERENSLFHPGLVTSTQPA